MPSGIFQRTYRPLEERFWAKVDRTGLADNDCWPWLGARAGTGYGNITRHGRGTSAPAHRVAYELCVGPIPEGLQIDHLCRRPDCVNPAHLEPVTQIENMRRGIKGVLTTHCPQGHEYSEANTYIDPRNSRRCRQCKRQSDAKYRSSPLTGRLSALVLVHAAVSS